jgi:hypothetical protein
LNPVDFAAVGGRRFILCMGCGLAVTALVWFGKIDGPVFRDIILGTIGVYVLGNTGQKVFEMKTTGLPAGTPVTAPASVDDMPQIIEAKGNAENR